MLAVERIRKIKEILLEYKNVDIVTLCSILSVSVATVRRDLDKLEEEGFLKKVHGGALLVESNNLESQLNGAFTDKTENEKLQIASIAAQFIENNDIIFLGSGRTCFQIAKIIKERKNLTVFTNNINIVLELANIYNIDVILPGGKLEVVDNNISAVGEYALKNLRDIYINKTFFTVDGASIEYGYTVNRRQEMNLILHLLSNSNDCFLVSDYHKFDKRAFVSIGSLDLVKTVITNIELPNIYKEYYFNNGIQLFTTIEEL